MIRSTLAFTTAGSKYQFPSYFASFGPSSAPASATPEADSLIVIDIVLCCFL